MLSAWDSFLQGNKTQGDNKNVLAQTSSHSWNYSEMRLWHSTCGSVRCIRIASSLDKQGCKAVLVKRGAVHDWSVVLKWVYWGVWRHGDILQGQPQSGAALVVLKFQVKSNKVDRLHAGLFWEFNKDQGHVILNTGWLQTPLCWNFCLNIFYISI